MLAELGLELLLELLLEGLVLVVLREGAHGTLSCGLAERGRGERCAAARARLRERGLCERDAGARLRQRASWHRQRAPRDRHGLCGRRRRRGRGCWCCSCHSHCGHRRRGRAWAHGHNTPAHRRQRVHRAGLWAHWLGRLWLRLQGRLGRWWWRWWWWLLLLLWLLLRRHRRHGRWHGGELVLELGLELRGLELRVGVGEHGHGRDVTAERERYGCRCAGHRALWVVVPCCCCRTSS